MKRTVIDRFMAKVRLSGGCWIWTAAVDKATGYGKFHDGKRTVNAHRWSYEYYVGPVPPGLQLDHLCRVRSCVSPGHLEPVTPSENLRRGDTFTARKAGQVACIHGHDFDAENTYIDTRGRRVCRECKRIRARTAYRRKVGIVQ